MPDGDTSPVELLPAAPATPAPPPVSFRKFGDAAETRRRIFENALSAASRIQPATNTRHTLALSEVGYEGPEAYPIAKQKQAILANRSLSRSLRGTWTLTDNVSGQPLGQKRVTLARIPYLTDRGTFINSGSEYAIAHQLRLRPGIFTRQKDNGELEAHVNVSKGLGHRLFMDPETGVFRVQFGQAKIPLLPLLRTMGTTDSQIREAWGNDLAAVNMQKEDAQAIPKLYRKLLGSKAVSNDPLTQRAAVAKAINEMELDAEVTTRTLGRPHTHITADAIMDATRKLLRVSKGEDESDDRDAMAYQRLVGPEDFFAERLDRAKEVARRMLWKAAGKQNLDHITPGMYDKAIQSVLLGSGLASPLEEINTGELLDQQTRVTRMGEGGITSMDAVPADSRAVQPTQFGFIDFLRTPESSKVGVDARLARNAVKGSDGRVYTQVRDAQTGETVLKSPQDLADIPLAFPNELRKNEPLVAAMVKGKTRMVPREQVQFEIPNMEDTFSPLGNMVPLKSMVKGQRAVMAARMLTQALPLQNAEAPLVQSGMPGQPDRSFEAEYGSHMGAVFAKDAGRVMDVSPDGIKVKYADGRTENHELYNAFPFNRKTLIHNTPLVQPGMVVQPGQILARSNFTDDKGTTALGMNARVAYIPYAGANFEDAVVVSDSFAKRLKSEHMYQHGLDWEASHKQGKSAFVSVFPSVYDKATLAKFDANGAVKPGTVVNYGDPLLLAVQQKEPNRKSLLRGRPSFTDATVTWNHHSPGEVTDVRMDEKGAAVIVKAYSAAQVGDKLSGRYGDKGVISKIVPDDEVPTDAQGRPFEIMVNPLGITSRTNPAQLVEAALGKIAAARGQPYKVQDFGDEEDMAEWAIKELDKHGIPDTEDVIDPKTGRKIPGVFTGNRWYMKLHHTSESKNQGRGLGGYTAEGTPAKGGDEGSKRIGMLELSSLLSHGASAVVRDAHLIRGQANPQFWSQYMSGFPATTPQVPHVYDKFVNDLRASGINPVRQGSRTQLMAMTDKDIDELAGDRELQNAQTVNWQDMSPSKGGLFDEALTGGHMNSPGGGKRWSFIRLAEPMPNPVFEEPIRRVLGLTKQRFEDVLAGKEEIQHQTGPAAIAKALGKIDLKRELSEARAQISSGKKTKRDEAIRKFGYLKSAEQLGVHPRDWVLSKAPVLPPAFRPVSTMGPKKLPLVADPNYLYAELWHANQNLREVRDTLGDTEAGDERLNLYNSFKAVTGLGDPTHPKNQERQVKGILKHVFGSSPKYGAIQRKLLGSAVDLVGRSVIAPDPDLDMDHVGVPENTAWTIYRPVLVRSLVRSGMSRMAAARAVEDKTPVARRSLLKEMESGVVIINRAPTLHRYGMMAARPTLVRGDVMKLSPLVVGGFGADFDGDAMQLHVPLSDDARQEALEKMLPSRNLLGVSNFKPMYRPTQEYVGGLYEATARIEKDKPPLVFETKADALRAYKSGQVGVGRRVQIVND